MVRLISFDVPIALNQRCDQLRHFLRSRRFGLLQRSLWISPDPLDTEVSLLRKTDVDPRSLILLQARTCGGESNADVVVTAWDFDRLNRLYSAHIEILNRRPAQKVRNKVQAKALLQWAQKEHEAWKNAVTCDPLLPDPLLPQAYQGQKAWRLRLEAFNAIGDAIKTIEL